MDKLERLEEILNLLGLDNIEDSNTVDDLYHKINQVKKIAEFNATIIQEMIKADIIPPIILKRSQLSCDLKHLKQKRKILSDRYEIFKENKAKQKVLGSLAKDLLTIQTEIEEKQDELDHL